jgi:hypothetical protein
MFGFLDCVIEEPLARPIESKPKGETTNTSENGWIWKFDSEAMGSRRFGEPVREYLQAVGCRAAIRAALAD